LIDLHIHTNYSDGTDTVESVLKKAEELKLKYISITDHDKCSAYKELKNINISNFYTGKIISGIEIKCAYKGRLIEVLGYNYNVENMQKWIDEYYKDKQRDVIQTKYFNILYDACLGMNIKMSPKEDIIWNPKNDWASLTIYTDFKKYEENKKILPSDLWEDFTTFTKKYCGDLKSAFHIDKSQDYPPLDVAIKAIKDCGGVALMAHIFIYRWAENKEDLIEDIINNYNIDGFECYYTKFTKEQEEYIVDVCNRHGLYKSGGSDYHGENKPNIYLGIGLSNLCINENILENWPSIKTSEV
jgi:predicted metal-dependent phosphoesterase TrpH